jgi:cytochrome c peroxidase
MVPRFRHILALGMALVVLSASPPGIANEVWTAEELAVLASLRLSELPAAPDDPSNAWQASRAAAELGRQLFFDRRFSRNQAVACASCHDPARQFQDDKPVGEGVGVGARRSMPVVAAGFGPWLFWDGRKDSLWSQALGPLEDPLEHGGNRLRYARLMQSHYRQDYVDVFGPLPDLEHLPEDASPRGTPSEQVAWQSLDPVTRDAVSRVFANMGKAIAAYERTLHHEPSPLDRYIDGGGTLTPQQLRGLRLFIGKGQCVSCHNGPLLTDNGFHNTGVPPRDAMRPDAGRALAIAKVREDEFNCLGNFSDAKPGQCQELRFLADDEQTVGAFRTPSLRGVAARSPYMHAGQFKSLEEVVRHYVEAPRAIIGRSELRSEHREGRAPIRLSAREQQDLVAFLNAL